MKSRLTRREIRHWFAPIRKALTEIRTTGETWAIRGYAATELNGELTRIDHCIAGWVGCLSRLLPDRDLQPMETLGKKFANGVPIAIHELDEALHLLNTLEQPMTRLSRQQVKDCVTMEMIQIELDELGLTRT